MRRKLHITAGAAALALLAGTAAHAVETQPQLTLESADMIVDTCLDMARDEGWNLAVALYDQHGNLKRFSRMDGVQAHSIEIAHLKAVTSAKRPAPTGALHDFTYGDPDTSPGAFAFLPGITVLRGGVPIMTESGAHLGGVGVSGATSQQDEDCANAGIEAIADRLAEH